MNKARVARFYHWTDAEIRTLDTETFFEYFRCIPALQAEEIMGAISVADFPTLTKAERNKRWAKLDRASKVLSKPVNGPKLTNKELAEILKNR